MYNGGAGFTVSCGGACTVDADCKTGQTCNKSTGVCQVTAVVKTYVLGFGVCPPSSPSCTAKKDLDAIAGAGGTGSAFLVTSSVDIEAAFASIIAGAIKPELCNGVDDNCNGLVDEGYNVYTPDGVPPLAGGALTPCGNGQKGNCAAGGFKTCVPPSIDPTQTSTYCSAPVCSTLCPYSAAVCALIDGAPPAVCPSPETCTNGDSDCDGIISSSCPPACSSPQPEVCNGLDDNCNGVVDECSASGSPGCATYGPGGGLSCGSSVGVCKPGVTECCTPSREGPVSTTTTGPVSAGGATVGVASGSGIEPGMSVVIDSGGAQETVVVTAVGGAAPPGTPPTTFTATFATAHASGVPVTATTACIAATAGTTVCVGGTGPATPVEANAMGLFCNNLDDDCNGRTDEGITRPCYPAGSAGCTLNADGVTYTCVGTCMSGVQTCKAGVFGGCVGAITPVPDLRCSGIDSMCNGAPPGPTPETCNGIDDDCDGIIDDHLTDTGGQCYPAGTTGCTLNPDGVTYTCAGSCAPGTIQCVAGKLACEGPTLPRSEICDGKDNDCNSLVDDGTLPGVGIPCATAGSACPGLTACTAGAITCTGSGGGMAGAPCYPPATVGCTMLAGGTFSCVGICKPGAIACVGGADVCEGAVTPGTEVCNGLDNNCDGTIPPTATCPVPGDMCDMGTCVAPCSGELGCPSGYVCEGLPTGKFCVPSLCKGVTCPSGQRCDLATGSCVDPCAKVTCGAGQTCVGGLCQDCSTLGCPTGQLCTGGLCVADLCFGKSCPSGQVCMEPGGTCVGTCAGVTCPTGQICVAGACVGDPCTGVTCPTGEICDPTSGACKIDPCAAIQCVAPTTCVDGTCVGDPCQDVICHAHEKCVTNTITGLPACQACTAADVHDGGGSCTPLVNPTPVLATGGGGCACAVGGGGGRRDGDGTRGALLLGVLVLGLALAVRRRVGRREGP